MLYRYTASSKDYSIDFFCSLVHLYEQTELHSTHTRVRMTYVKLKVESSQVRYW